MLNPMITRVDDVANRRRRKQLGHHRPQARNRRVDVHPVPIEREPVERVEEVQAYRARETGLGCDCVGRFLGQQPKDKSLVIQKIV
jgi:hypothetical protein